MNTQYRHRNGETDLPGLPGEYYFSGVSFVDLGHYSAYRHFRAKVQITESYKVSVPYYDDFEVCSLWQMEGRWWGPREEDDGPWTEPNV